MLLRSRSVSAARILLAIAVLFQFQKSLASATISFLNVENVDASDESCESYMGCVLALKQTVGGKISINVLNELQSCLQHAVVDCPMRPSPWFGLAAVMAASGNLNASNLLCKIGHRLSEDATRSLHRSGTRTPFLSIVLASRADTYRGDPLKQACLGLRSIAMNANAMRIATEVVFVDYNSPSGRSVAQTLPTCLRDIPAVESYLALRFVVVPLWVLRVSAAITADGGLLPFNEYVAKNVGIRRASGKYIIVSNPEVVLPTILWSQFAVNPRTFFRKNLLVASDRRDSWSNIEPMYEGVNELEKQLDAGVRVVWSHLQEDGSTLPRASDLGLAPKAYFAALTRALEQCPWQDAEIKWQGNGSSLAATFSGIPSVNSIHHTASGDFIMAHRTVWMRARGYFDVWSFERPPIDSLTVSKMVLGLKMRQMVLRGQYAVWHYSHEPFKADDVGDTRRHTVSDMPANLNFFHFFKWISHQRGSSLTSASLTPSLASVNSCAWGLCTPFSALELPFTTERLFRCGSSNPSVSCLIAPEELSRVCTNTARFPLQSFDYFLMPSLQLFDEDPSVAAAIVNTGCLMMQRNKCAYDTYFTRFTNESQATLSSTTCCANLAAANMHTATQLQDNASEYLDLQELICS